MGTVDPRIGRSIGGKFVIESLIGTGAMGSVYLAKHATLEARVAVKVMHEEMAKDQTFAERFLREARAASRLDHPNVICVRDFGTEPDGLHYLVMDYVDGVDLGQLVVREFPMLPGRIVDILSQVLSATAAAHDVGVVHRDLKPDNVMVSARFDDEGRKHEVVKVCDFGIAQMNELPRMDRVSQRPLTLSGVLLGTPQYMSPEQCRGEALDARSDLYSVGVILYELLAGQAPFVAENFIDIVLKHVSEEPVPPSALQPNVHGPLEQVCLKALRKRRDERFASARDMRAALRAAIGISDEPSASGLVPELRASIPGMDTQPSFSSRVLSYGAPRDLPTLRLQQETLPVPPQEAGGRVFRYVVGATLLALVGTAVVFSRERATPPVDPAPRLAAGAPAIVRPEVARETEAKEANERPPEPTTPVAGPEPAPRPAIQAKAAHRPVKNEREAPRGGAGDEAPSPSVVPAVSEVPAVEPPRPPEPRPPPAESGVREPPVSVPPAEPAAKMAPSSVDASKGSVSWRVSAVGGGATAGGVARALSRAAAWWTDCYRSGLRARAARLEGTATLRIACDDQGRVVEARVSPFGMPDVARCMEQRAMGATIPNADTGEAWSTVSLTFRVNE